MFQHTKLYLSFQNLSLGFILKIFLKFRKFQPRYSYLIYSYIYEKRVYIIVVMKIKLMLLLLLLLLRDSENDL